MKGARLLPLLLLAAALCPLAAQSAGAPLQAEMRGSVLEAVSRRPLTGAVATLHADSDPGSHYLTSSDTEGRFLLHGLPAGSYTLEVSLAGHRDTSKHGIVVRPPFRSIVEMLLEPASAPGPDASRTAGAGGAADRQAAGSGPAAAEAAAPSAPGSGGGSALLVTLSDRAQRPVPEGLVALVPAEGEGERRYARSDASGRVEFASLPPLRYRLTASAPGYLTVRAERLALGGGSTARVAVVLTPYPLDFAGTLEDLLPPEEPLLPRRLEIDSRDGGEPQPGRTP